MCTFCGYEGVGSCREALNELMLWSLTQPRPPFIHQVVVDAYAVQHLNKKGLTPIQKIFALYGLCQVIENGLTGYEVQQEHIRISRKKVVIDWPELPDFQPSFALDVGDVLSALDRVQATFDWAGDAWAAWAPAHEIVRNFIRKN